MEFTSEAACVLHVPFNPIIHAHHHLHFLACTINSSHFLIKRCMQHHHCYSIQIPLILIRLVHQKGNARLLLWWCDFHLFVWCSVIFLTAAVSILLDDHIARPSSQSNLVESTFQSGQTDAQCFGSCVLWKSHDTNQIRGLDGDFGTSTCFESVFEDACGGRTHLLLFLDFLELYGWLFVVCVGRLWDSVGCSTRCCGMSVVLVCCGMLGNMLIEPARVGAIHAVVCVHGCSVIPCSVVVGGGKTIVCMIINHIVFLDRGYRIVTHAAAAVVDWCWGGLHVALIFILLNGP